MRIETGLLSTIGKTPLVELKKLYPRLSSTFYAKLEMFNPGGSTKDRPAALMLSRAIEEGKIHSDTTIIESSSGNMAIGLAQNCCYLGLHLIVVTDPNINRHTLALIQAYGARVERVTEADSSGNYLKNRLKRVKQLLETIPDSYWPNQYSNDLNPAAHYETMDEIVNSFPVPPDYILGATSTCGTVMGCVKYIREHHLDTKVVAVDAVGSVIFGSSKGRRLIPGHGAGRKSDLLDKTHIHHVLHMSDRECVIGCRRLLNREAILAGGSSGAVVMAAEKLHSFIPKGSTCVMIFADSGERYLETIYNDAWVESHFEQVDESFRKEKGRKKELTVLPVPGNERKLSIDDMAIGNGRNQDYL